VVDAGARVRLLRLDRMAGASLVGAIHPTGYSIPNPLRTFVPSAGLHNRAEYAEEK